MKNVFSFCNQKGGVGKTTSAVNIAAFMAKKGHKVLLIDLDAQGNATSGLGLDKENLKSTAYELLVDNFLPNEIIQKTSYENLDIIPSNTNLSGAEIELTQVIGREFVLKNKLDTIKETYDFIFIDCPPSLGLISINSLVSSNYLIIPLQCEYYSLEGLGQLLNIKQLIQKNLNQGLEVGGVILTMADFRTNLTQQVIEEVKQYFSGKVFESVIPRSVKISEAPSFGQPAIFYDAHNKASKQYIALGEEFEKRFWKIDTPAEKEEVRPENESEPVSIPTTEGEKSS